jgi:hypothetical protein
MRLIQFFQQLRIWLHYRRAAFVNTREELEAALRLMPPRIVVDGDEGLRAFAATLTEGEQQPEWQPPPGTPDLLIIPPLGRVRGGRGISGERGAATRPPLRGGLDMVLVAITGICAALIAEWLSFPEEPHLVERPHSRIAGKMVAHAAPAASAASHWVLRLAVPLFGAIAIAAFAWVLWQALGLNRPLRTEWRLEYRIHGRLVMERIRRRAA